jgi:hypothetical protein
MPTEFYTQSAYCNLEIKMYNILLESVKNEGFNESCRYMQS